jgi:PIN domain nuclease of toxin-antitoxin system
MIGKHRGDPARHPHLDLVGPRDEHLPARITSYVERHEKATLGVSAISCWEVAKLVERGRLHLPMPTGDWLHAALSYPGVRLLDLTPDISAESCSLPGDFHATRRTRSSSRLPGTTASAS